MATRDHVVPRMYLRRFAEQRAKTKRHYLMAAPADRPDQSFLSAVENVAVVGDFHWYTQDDGTRHHGIEKLMTHIEGRAAGALSSMLDGQFALPTTWPLRPDLRAWMALWMSAQFLRTVQKREWLSDGQPSGPGPHVVADRKIAEAAKTNEHLEYLIGHLNSLASVLSHRPWGFGVTTHCLPTCDSPMISLDVNHRENLYAQVMLFDLLLPLDSHRFLILPCDQLIKDDPSKRSDHLVRDPGMLGPMLSSLVYDWSLRQVFHHPSHYPFATHLQVSSRMPKNRDGRGADVGHAMIGDYPVLPTRFQVDRCWLSDHIVRPEALAEGESPDEYLQRKHQANIATAALRLTERTARVAERSAAEEPEK
jgi:Protein of unknown function (DUF4238)